LGTEEGGKVIGEMLKGNSVLRELDLSGNSVYPASENSPKFAVALSPGLADNRGLAGSYSALSGLSSLDLTANGIGAGAMAPIIRVVKDHAIRQQRACACLVGNELMTKDLRALLVATYNLHPRCCRQVIGIEQLYQDIATWL
jgi:hypothetical protein